MTARQVVAYVRVSTEKQSLSLDAQTAKLRAMAVVKGVDLDDVLVDTVSAKDLEHRPAMVQLLERIDRGQVATVLIVKLDRLTRSIRDLADLLVRFDRQQVALVSVDESLDTRSSSGRLVIYLLGVFAQWERERIGERTRDALQHKKANGERVGTLPFGYQLEAGTKRLEPAPAEQRLLVRMRELYATLHTSRRIADALRGEGWTTRRGTPVAYQTVARMLKVVGGKS